MTDKAIAEPQTKSIPLRLAEPIIGKGVWLCPDDKFTTQWYPRDQNLMPKIPL